MKAVSRQSIVENFLLSATTSSGCQTAVEVERAVQTMRHVGLRDDLVVLVRPRLLDLESAAGLVEVAAGEGALAGHLK